MQEVAASVSSASSLLFTCWILNSSCESLTRTYNVFSLFLDWYNRPRLHVWSILFGCPARRLMFGRNSWPFTAAFRRNRYHSNIHPFIISIFSFFLLLRGGYNGAHNNKTFDYTCCTTLIVMWLLKFLLLISAVNHGWAHLLLFFFIEF